MLAISADLSWRTLPRQPARDAATSGWHPPLLEADIRINEKDRIEAVMEGIRNHFTGDEIDLRTSLPAHDPDSGQFQFAKPFLTRSIDTTEVGNEDDGPIFPA